MRTRTLIGQLATLSALVGALCCSSCTSHATTSTGTPPPPPPPPPAPTQLAIVTQPASASASGAALTTQPAVQLLDASGTVVDQANVLVTAAIATGGGTLGGAVTAPTNAVGTATFTNLAITGLIGPRTLIFTSPSLTAATSTSIIVAPGAAAELAVTTEPSPSAASGAAFGQQPVVQLRDASTNPVSQAGVPVTSTIATGGGALAGTVTATTNGSGSAAFVNLAISGLVGNRTLTFSAPSLVGATSTAVAITPGVAAQLAVTTQPPASVVSGVVLGQQPAVQLEDGVGNVVSQAGIVVTASIIGGTATLGGTVTATTNANGVATYTNLSITGIPATYTLAFSAASLNGAQATGITVTSALPSLAGTWSGTWMDNRYGVSGTITNVVLTQSATTFGGTGTINLSALGLGSQNGTATGTIAGDIITFTFTAATIGSGSGTLAGSNNTGTGNGSGSVTASSLGAFNFTGTATSTQITGTFTFTSPTGGFGTITVTKQ